MVLRRGLRLTDRLCLWAGLGLVSAVWAAEAQPAAAELPASATVASVAARPQTAAEIIPARPPPEDNAAPLIMEAIAALEAENVWNTTLAGLAAEACGSGYGASAGRNLAGLVESLRIPAEGGRAPTVAEVCEEFARQLEGPAARRALALCTQATARPRCWFPLDYSKGANIMLPHLSELRHLARFLATAAHVEAERGDGAAAWELVSQQLRLADLLREEPILISQLVRSAVLRMAVSTLQDVAALVPPSPEVMRQLDGLLDRLDDLAPWAASLDGERLLVGDWIFAQPAEKIRDLLKAEGATQDVATPTAAQLATGHAAYTAAMLRLAELASRPYYSVKDDLKDDLVAMASPANLADTIVVKSILPALTSACVKAADCQAVLRVARVGLRLLAQRAQQGAYPAALDAGLLAGLPPEKQVDPFTGKGLCYRPEGEGFVLYSVGPDGIDDGGKPRGGDAKQGFDTVWRAPR